ncbi:MAG: hypothetical protein IJ879_03180 [Muribaculaceae bacterium]|nr:hypothetical protein [Muribaculaceae bacterium]
MRPTPINREIIDRAIDEYGIIDYANATIREVKAIAERAERESGQEFIKMEMGIPVCPLPRSVSRHRPRPCRTVAPASIPPCPVSP